MNPLGNEVIQKGCGTINYLEYVSLEDVVSQLHCLLPVQFALLPGEHEGQESVATPVNMCIVLINQKWPKFYSPFLTRIIFFLYSMHLNNFLLRDL